MLTYYFVLFCFFVRREFLTFHLVLRGKSGVWGGRSVGKCISWLHAFFVCVYACRMGSRINNFEK